MSRDTREAATQPDPLIDSEELSEILQVSGRQVRLLAQEGRIPCYRVGGVYRFRANEVLEALRRSPQPDGKAS